MSSRTTAATRPTVSASFVACRRGERANVPARRAIANMSPAVPAAASSGQLDAPGLGLGPPLLARLGVHRVRARVEQQHGEVHRGEAVRHRVVQLGHHPHAPVLEARREQHLPQRALAVRAATEKAASVSEAKLARVSGSSSSDSASTCREMSKLASSTQNGSPKPVRRERQPLAKARREVQAAEDALAQRGQRWDGRARGAARRERSSPTCMWALGVSTLRNEPSSGRRRVRICPLLPSGVPRTRWARDRSFPQYRGPHTPRAGGKARNLRVGSCGQSAHEHRRAAPARVAAAGQLAGLRIARHGLHAAEVEVALRPARDLPAVALERLELRLGRCPAPRPPRRTRSARAGCSTASLADMPSSTTPEIVWRIAERIRFDPAEPSATSGLPSRSTTVGAIMLGIRASRRVPVVAVRVQVLPRRACC